MKAVILLFALIAILVAVNIPAINGESLAKADPEISMDTITSWVKEIMEKLKRK